MNHHFSRPSFSLILQVFALALGLNLAAGGALAADNDRLVNLSTRGLVGTGENVMLTGFVIGDGAPKKVLIRAVGPGLTHYGISSPLADPVIALYDSKGVAVAANDTWSQADASTMAGAGAFALDPGSKDAALVATLSPGLYSAQVSGVGGTSGVALLEVYDISGPARLVNLSTRAVVGSGDSTLIAGLVVASGTPRRLLVRAVGPGLSELGVHTANPDPAVAVLDSQGRQLASNDNWETANGSGQLTTAFAQAGAFGLKAGTKDAALITELGAGTYSIQVSGVNGANGVALVEVYDLGAGSTSTPTTPTADGTLYVAYLRAASAATGSTGYGTATIRLSSDEQSAFVNVGFANLSSPEVTAHLVLDGNFVFGLPVGQVSGAYWTFAPVGTYTTADLVAALKAGRITISIDSAKYTSGELGGSFVRNSAGVFSAPAPAPAIDLSTISSADASRFLVQATFGPIASDIKDLTKKSYATWIADQMALPATPHRAYTMDDFSTYNIGGQGVQLNGLYPYPGGVHRQAAWWKIVMTAPDQLRQRVAFALSQIFVVSDQDANLNEWQEGLASYYDVLVANAFGNYRTLLEQVTLHPVMGVYLSSLRNGKGAIDPNGVPIASADENYAREVMQLFSIGLNELNPDGTLKLDASGLPIPTYNQDTIVETAKVFTGWAFSSTDGARQFRTTGGNRPQDWTTPMMLYPEFHEDAAKTIVTGKVLPAGQGGTQDLKDMLDTLFNHPNTGPFICRELIQRLVTSNPSPGYVYRVAQVFADNGSGVRGDLGAVVKAILLDYEARSPGLLGAPGHGKLKEPILRATALMRAFHAKSDSGRYTLDAYPQLVQAALRAPTVFNFYQPDYVAPGTLAGAGLYAPEFQILTDTTAITGMNFLHFYTYNPKPALPSVDNAQAIYLQLDDLLPLAGTPQAIVDQLNLIFTAGAMSKTTSDRIVAAVNAMPNATEPDAFERVRAAIYLALVAPESAIQR